MRCVQYADILIIVIFLCPVSFIFVCLLPSAFNLKKKHSPAHVTFLFGSARSFQFHASSKGFLV